MSVAGTAADRGGVPLRRQLGAAMIGITVAVLLAALVGSVVYVRLDRANEDLTSNLFQAQAAARDVYESSVNQETGVRGFLLDESPEFLDPYVAGDARIRSAFDRLHVALRNRPELTRQVDDLQQASVRWNEDYAWPAIDARKNGRAVSAAQTQQGKQLFDDVRSRYELLFNSLSSERREAIRHQRLTLEQLGLIEAGTVLLLLVVLALAWRAINERVVRPVDRLVRDVERVSNGEIEHEVTGHGPADVVALGRAVDTMRLRIVGELRDVEIARTELARSNADLEQFAYVASHDLQEPLRKVASFCQLLEQRYEPQLDDRGKQYIGFAVDGAKRMQRLINDLLAFSRVGRSADSFEPVNLNVVLEDAKANLHAAINEAHARVDAEYLPTVDGEPELLTALLQNLVGNAVKFRHAERDPVVTISVSDFEDHWQFTVADNGIGIDAAYADKIFVIFQRLHGRDEYGGTGIGLAMCKKIVEFHGGRIWLDNSVHDGTVFQFTLPHRRNHDDPAATQTIQPEE